MPTAIFIPLALLTVGILLGVSSLLLKLHMVSAEMARKIVHIGMGLVCLGFPLLEVSTTAVVLLTFIASAVLLLIRLTKASNPFASALFSVDRSSSGELLFPIAVAWVYAASAGNTVLYIIPVLVLTLSDAAGALVGTRYGAEKYQCSNGTKSVEGSATFFLVTFLAIHIPLLLLSDTGRPECLLIALVISGFITAVEGMSGKGTDNILVPIGTYFLLDRYLPMGSAELIGRGLALGAILLILLATRKMTTLNGGAMLAALLYGFGALHLGGVVPLVSLLLLFALHVATSGKLKKADYHKPTRHTSNQIVALALPALGWLLTARSGVIAPTWGPLGFCLTTAFQAGLLHIGILAPDTNLRKPPLSVILKSLIVAAPMLHIVEPLTFGSLMLLVAGAAWGCAVLFRAWRLPMQPDDPLNGWVKLTLVATTASIAVYLVAQLPVAI
ncbi:diacylglycerol/polyprenol kinase family protein [Sulfuriroseicoccus oceanibius]|uniref:Phosphatidate cytidylyltransferase n=1 Tax=Sulfuriroseicoccus oceanibius TaxID=2707525 RepID=A0A6B3L7P1_9BACT|nr:hypothetical protein [Sulfuriroseicoccus oceanibius]QQL44247.1 hypothetical protein G3M56_010115 [Sulfuriroseicoccus oceanibius]